MRAKRVAVDNLFSEQMPRYLKAKAESNQNSQVEEKTVISWKLWKEKRKEEHKKWKEANQIKKIKQFELQKKAEISATKPEEVVDTSSTTGRWYTVSIAIPGSILDNAQSVELKTYLAGQVARAAAVFNVDEIIVFDELGVTRHIEKIDDEALKMYKKQHGCIQMTRILQYLECPQYLRRYFFPIHADLEYAGLLNPLDIPHHLRVEDESVYREGIVLKKPVKDGKGSFVYIGLQKSAIIDKPLAPNVRVTVKLDAEQPYKRHFKGKAVSPSAPSKMDGIYWGYSVRFAKSLGAVFSECPYKEGYDLTIGTSDKGKDVDTFSVTPFKHLLIVFGGLKGLENCLEADESLGVDDPSYLFNQYLNTCPSQGSRTIRTEEAILITMSVLRPKILESQIN